MCLRTVDFSMYWDADLKMYVGKGYKALERRYKHFDEWQEATGWSSKLDIARKNGIERVSSDDYNSSYVAGFHIFLNEEDAMKYESLDVHPRFAMQHSTYEVTFTDVLGFGENYTRQGNYGPCIIAKSMFVHRVGLRNQKGELKYNVE